MDVIVHRRPANAQPNVLLPLGNKARRQDSVTFVKVLIREIVWGAGEFAYFKICPKEYSFMEVAFKEV